MSYLKAHLHISQAVFCAIFVTISTIIFVTPRATTQIVCVNHKSQSAAIPVWFGGNFSVISLGGFKLTTKTTLLLFVVRHVYLLWYKISIHFILFLLCFIEILVTSRLNHVWSCNWLQHECDKNCIRNHEKL